MNKYELGIKIDQIKKLAAKKEYTEAAAIAKDINWTILIPNSYLFMIIYSSFQCLLDECCE